MTDRTCIDCAKGAAPRRPRPVVSLEGSPARCATHLRSHLKDAKKKARARAVERTYGITEADNHELYMFQGGRCWLCRKATGATKSLAVDHDHQTGEVRGRLCGPCNQFIGTLRDDPEAARRLASYLSGDTPYRRLKARQVLPDQITVHSVVEMGGELYATWSYYQDPDQVWYRTLVRRADGEWAVTR